MFASIALALLVATAPHAAEEPVRPLKPSEQDVVRDSSEEVNRDSEREGESERARDSEREEEEEEPRSRFEDSIETDRDAFTPATRTAPVNRWIMESSYSYIDNRSAPATNSFPELLLRYGVMNRLELRLGWNFEVGGGGNVVSGSSGEAVEGVDTSHLTREHRLLYGLKASLTEQERWLPDSIVILQGYTPTGGEATATQLVATYAWGWRLPNRWRFDSALRLATDSDNGNRFQVWAPSTVLRVPLGERFQVHAEYFGLMSQNRSSDFSRHFFSPGMHYLITPNLELGVRVGWGLNQQTAPFFTNVGFGLRF
jgi:hypothetical protein